MKLSGCSSVAGTIRKAMLSNHPLRPAIRGLLKRAALCALTFVLAHLLGFRSYTSLLSGTSSFGMCQSLCGVAYLVFYVGFVYVMPVLLIAACFLQAVVLIGALRARRHPVSAAPSLPQ